MTEKKKGLVISGGHISERFALDFIENLKPDMIVAADRGLEFCMEHKVIPHALVGDFDSIAPGVLEHFREEYQVPVDAYQPEKDWTDTDIAVKKILSMGAEEVYLLGTTGTRLDHVLSNIYNLVLLKRQGIQGWIADENNLITMPPGNEMVLIREKLFGKYVSLFVCGSPVEGVTLQGFKYLLKDRTLTVGDGGLTVSNELAADTGVISWKAGDLIVMETRD